MYAPDTCPGRGFLFELVNKLVDQRLLLRLERRPALKKLVLLIRQLHKIPIRKKLRQRNAEGFADELQGCDARLVIAVEYI